MTLGKLDAIIIRIILNVMTFLNVILNDGSGFRVDILSGNTSCIDLTLCRPGVSQRFS